MSMRLLLEWARQRCGIDSTHLGQTLTAVSDRHADTDHATSLTISRTVCFAQRCGLIILRTVNVALLDTSIGHITAKVLDLS